MTSLAVDTAQWSELLQQLLDRDSLSIEQASTLMQGWLKDEIPPVISGGILMALQMKGISAAELAGMAKVLQSQAQFVDRPDFPLIDTCGTGGDGSSTFNISTAVAFVASAAGLSGETWKSIGFEFGRFSGCTRSVGREFGSINRTDSSRSSRSWGNVFVCSRLASCAESRCPNAENSESSHCV